MSAPKRRRVSPNPGQPSHGDSPRQSETLRTTHVQSVGVFKASTEGVRETLSPNEVSEPTIGEWLAGFEAPSIDHAEFAEAAEAEEAEELLPAWMGSYVASDVAERTFGADTRKRIGDTTQFPFRTICQLIITAKNGKKFLGTGWFGGDRILYTAGHCTFMQNEGGLVSRITIYPGRNGATLPYPAVEATNWGCTESWASSGSQASDIGCVFVGAGAANVGNLGFNHPYSESQLLQLKIHVVGYPGDKPSGEMWGDGNQLTRVYPDQLKYLIDTKGGQSGAPVFTSDGLVVGIHNYGGNDGNLASRITPQVKSILEAWWRLSGSTR